MMIDILGMSYVLDHLDELPEQNNNLKDFPCYNFFTVYLFIEKKNVLHSSGCKRAKERNPPTRKLGPGGRGPDRPRGRGQSPPNNTAAGGGVFPRPTPRVELGKIYLLW